MIKTSLPEHMKYAPAVFAVGRTYQIFAVIDASSTFWIEVNGKRYCDESNGILRSETPVHRVEVPMEELDSSGRYTVVYRLYPDRKPYFPEGSEPYTAEFVFRPVSGDRKGINILHISDTHNMCEEPVAFAERWAGDTDLLVLNGDIPDSSSSFGHMETVFAIAGGITGGSIPAVFSRGNHDTRGLCAEEFERYTPSRSGKTYYSFRCGSLWGLVLDCGEDKADDNPEYGGTVCMHDFRERETEYIRSVIADKENEYAAPGVEHIVLICHIPFTFRQEPPFDIEDGIYSEWSKLLREHIKPEILLYGHIHAAEIWHKGGPHDHRGQCAGAVIGGLPLYRADGGDYIGAMIKLGDEYKSPIQVIFSDSHGETVGEGIIQN